MGTPKQVATKDAGQPVTQSVNARKQEVKVTDWQSYDAQVDMKFTDSQVEVTMDGQSDKVFAKWRVLEKTPANILVEFVTESKQSPTTEESATETQPSKVLRRFEIIPELEEEKLTGFALNEEGADRQVGRLYFVRKGEQVKTENISAQDDSQD